MSTMPISSTGSTPVCNNVSQSYIHQRRVDLNQLQQALQSGNLTAAQTAYNAIVSLGQSGPFANGAPFGVASREQDFQAIGTALQAGDLAGATQAFQTLWGSFQQPAPGSPVGNSSSSAGPDVVVNLSGGQ